MMRTKEEIEQEIENLKPMCRDYDTGLEVRETCLSVGAHDGLRWALGLAGESISEALTRE